MLDNYPVSGLGSITTSRRKRGVSTPTVARMVQKLGYKGYPDFPVPPAPRARGDDLQPDDKA
jgi:DNA-binding MurR/RpiR family transcriptional regulator